MSQLEQKAQQLDEIKAAFQKRREIEEGIKQRIEKVNAEIKAAETELRALDEKVAEIILAQAG